MKKGTRATYFEVGRNLHVIEPNKGPSRQARVAKTKAWLVLDQLALLLQKAMFESGDVEKFEANVTKFYSNYEVAWGSTNLTQYMVCPIISSTQFYCCARLNIRH